MVGVLVGTVALAGCTAEGSSAGPDSAAVSAAATSPAPAASAEEPRAAHEGPARATASPSSRPAPRGAVAGIPDPADLPPMATGIVQPDGDSAVTEPDRGTTVRLVGVTSHVAEGSGRGDLGGPAVLVEIRVDAPEGTELAPFVDLRTGRDGVPASPVTGDSEDRPLPGVVGRQGTATGVYVFSLPSSDVTGVLVTVGIASDTPVSAFAVEVDG